VSSGTVRRPAKRTDGRVCLLYQRARDMSSVLLNAYDKSKTGDTDDDSFAFTAESSMMTVHV